MKWLNILILIFFSNLTFANLEIACSHEEICKIVKSIDQTITTKLLVNISGDPHEYEPSANEIKSFLSSPILITGPIELNPWIKKINYQRSKNSNLKTYSLRISNEAQTFYNSNNKEALSHFWLYPKIYCDFSKQILELDLFKHFKKVNKCTSTKIEESLQAILGKIDNPVVLTHDALYPLLKKYTDKKIVIINLKGSNHHEEISPLAIKEVYKISNNKTIWIIEKNISMPEAIKNKIKNGDKKIYIDTAKAETSESFSILNQILRELN